MDNVVTGEAVVLDVPVARFPSRMLAIAIDLAIQLVALAILLVLVAATQVGGGLDDAAGAAIALSVTVLVVVGYPTVFETLSRGRSVGKLVMGLRVVGDDGGPERFRQALVRSLASVLEIWSLLGAPALITSLLSAKGKRLGDIFAGTFVIQERLRASHGAPVGMPPPLAAWAATLELSGLPGETAAIARSYLGRFWELTPAAREEFGRRIAAEVAARVSPPPPPGTPPAAYLAAVLAERHAREAVRMNWAARPGAPGLPGYGPAPGQGTVPGYGTAPGYGAPGYGAAPWTASRDGAPGIGTKSAPGPSRAAEPGPSPAAEPGATPAAETPAASGDGAPPNAGGFTPPV